MAASKYFVYPWLALALGTILIFILDLSLGSVSIPLSQTMAILTGQEVENSAWEQIILLFRLQQFLRVFISDSRRMELCSID